MSATTCPTCGGSAIQMLYTVACDRCDAKAEALRSPWYAPGVPPPAWTFAMHDASGAPGAVNLGKELAGAAPCYWAQRDARDGNNFGFIRGAIEEVKRRFQPPPEPRPISGTVSIGPNDDLQIVPTYWQIGPGGPTLLATGDDALRLHRRAKAR